MLPALPERYSRQIVFGGRFRARLKENLLVTCLVFAILSGLACIPAFATHVMTNLSRNDLDQAATAVHSEMIKDGRHSFPSPQQTAKDISASDPNLTVFVAPDQQAYRRLKAHEIGDGAIAVVKSTPTELELLARRGDNGIVEFSAPLSGVPTYHKRYVGHSHLGRLYFAEVFLGLLALILWPLGTLAEDADDRHERLFARGAVRQTQARWRELVTDSRFGPDEPEEGFRLWSPEKREHEDEVVLEARPVEWRRGQWQGMNAPKPQGLETVRLPLAAGLAQATEAWVDFCHRTADENAKRHRARLEAIAEKEHARLEAEEAKRRLAEEEEARRRERAIVANLPDRSELLRSAPVE